MPDAARVECPDQRIYEVILKVIVDLSASRPRWNANGESKMPKGFFGPLEAGYEARMHRLNICPFRLDLDVVRKEH